ncbi:anthrone oxygenase family protein (plasmid) [Streptomyces sp. HUAS TT3]|uniref:anthrone oxygenase family protein n=1 Tax=Streptomyces sp. HUAS TT3 TaxID=3447510 RepID=UPI003F658FE9
MATGAALVAYVLALGVTGRVNIPLNNTLEQAGPVDRIADRAAVRRVFESRWVAANRWRAVLCTVALGCLTWAVSWSETGGHGEGAGEGRRVAHRGDSRRRPVRPPPPPRGRWETPAGPAPRLARLRS